MMLAENYRALLLMCVVTMQLGLGGCTPTTPGWHMTVVPLAATDSNLDGTPVGRRTGDPKRAAAVEPNRVGGTARTDDGSQNSTSKDGAGEASEVDGRSGDNIRRARLPRGAVIVAEGEVRGKPGRLWVHTERDLDDQGYLHLTDAARVQFVLGGEQATYVSGQIEGYLQLAREQDSAEIAFIAREPVVDRTGRGEERFHLRAAVRYAPLQVLTLDASSRLESTAPSPGAAGARAGADPSLAPGANVRAEATPGSPLSGRGAARDAQPAAGADTAWPPGAAPRDDYVPTFLPFERGSSPPTGYVLEKRRSWGLFAVGTSAFVVGYGGSLAIAAGVGGRAKPLAAPVAGPLIVWGKLMKQWLDEGSGSGLVGPLFVTQALVGVTTMQALGIAGIIISLKPRPFRWRRESAAVAITPKVGPQDAGMVVSGRF